MTQKIAGKYVFNLKKKVSLANIYYLVIFFFIFNMTLPILIVHILF